MKKILGAVLACMLALGGAGCAKTRDPKAPDPEDAMQIVTMQSKLAALPTAAEQGVIADSSGNPTFASGNKHATVWGVENDQWATMNLSKSNFDRYIEASLRVNANAIAVHMPWNVVEPEMGKYATGKTSYLQYCVDKARAAGLKIVVYFTSVNYASGDGSFVPQYVRNDKNTYTRMVCPGVYDGNAQTVASEITYCINNEALLARERLALIELMQFIKKNNDDGIFTAINLCSEVDYSRNWNSGTSIDTTVRCHCDVCNELYQSEGHEGETPYEFMLRTYNDYVKRTADIAAGAYDGIAMYTPVAALTWFVGGRYAEQPDRIKQTVGRDNFFVCPSIAPTQNYAMYQAEMAYFTPDAIEGNAAFASGIDTGHDGIPFNNQAHLELAPWQSILNYGGLGAIYWDYPETGDGGATRSILNPDNAISARLRTGWAPLKAMDFAISRFKGDDEVLGWWSYEQNKASVTLGTFTVQVNRNEEELFEHANYGIVVLNDKKDLLIAATDYEPEIDENNVISVTRAGGFDGFAFEVGYLNASGGFVKTGNFSPACSGDTLTYTPAYNGDYTKAVYRIVKA